jgi:hypothetical protein
MQPDLPAHPYKVSRLGTHQKSVYLPYLKYPVRILGWGPAKITEVFHAFPQCHHRNSRIVARIGLRILPATSFENQHSPIILKFQSIRKDKVELQLHFHTVHLFVCPVITAATHSFKHRPCVPSVSSRAPPTHIGRHSERTPSRCGAWTQGQLTKVAKVLGGGGCARLTACVLLVAAT